MLQITNLTLEKIDKKFLEKAFLATQKTLGEKIKEISLVLVNDEKIREINKKYRQKNKITDVLSFEELNEIFISLPQAKRQAKRLKHSLNCELTRLFVHGIVHLAGFDHEYSEKEAREMERIENKILEKIGENRLSF